MTVIDFDHAANNTFHVTDEWEYTSGLYTNRADVIFLINGVPVAVVETKAAIEHHLQECPECAAAVVLQDDKVVNADGQSVVVRNHGGIQDGMSFW